MRKKGTIINKNIYLQSFVPGIAFFSIVDITAIFISQSCNTIILLPVKSICFYILKKNIIGQFRHSVLNKFFIIIPCHPYIEVIIPGYKSLVSYSANKRTAC